MASVMIGANRLIDSKDQKYPINSYCVKVGWDREFARMPLITSITPRRG